MHNVEANRNVSAFSVSCLFKFIFTFVSLLKLCVCGSRKASLENQVGVKIELLKYCSKKGSARACVCVCVHKVGGARRGKV